MSDGVIRRLTIVLAFLAAVGAVAGGVWRYGYLQALDQLARQGASDLALASDRLTGQLQRYRELAVLVADHPQIGAVLAGEDVERLSEVRALGDCENCTFEDQDFSGKKLTGINLSNAALDNVVFDKSEMNISLFEGATLRNVSFVGTNLRGASFVGARPA